MTPAVYVEDLSKRYLLGRSSPGQGGLRHALENLVTAPMRLFGGRKEERTTEFWALRGVGFEIAQGDVVGIIGRNGAGKSTLLKILSRITEPTTGRIGVKGRIASLLEVGTGFHPELTGRENIFLNGAILGMTQTEVRSKLDEIIAFAGIEKFLETPVKRYSSGMYVRLAFAVAAHLEPEILVIDEVLAVGDAEFQKKCLGKMKEVSKSGRTVLFVSHNLPAVSLLCDRGIYLRGGQVMASGEIGPVLSHYRDDFLVEDDATPDASHRRGTGAHRIVRLATETERLPARAPISFSLEIKQHRDEGPFHFAMHVRDEWDTEVFSVDTAYLESGLLQPGDRKLCIEVDSPWLFPGRYRIEAFLHIGGIVDHWPDACRFEIDGDVAKHGYSLDSAKNRAQTLASFRIEESAG